MEDRIDFERELVKAARTLAVPGAQDDMLETVTRHTFANILFALWDSGYYEFVADKTEFSFEEAVEKLGYDRLTFECILENLEGRKLVERAGDAVKMTERGLEYNNLYVRGLLTLFRGGYGELLANLGRLLRREISIDHPSLDRSGAHVGLGTEWWSSVRVLPGVFAYLRERAPKMILDLGSGAGGFLIQWLQSEPRGRAIGIDMSRDAVEKARAQSRAFGLGDRLSFHVGEVGRSPIDLPAEVLRDVDCITAMYMLHEFGREGRAGIVRVLRALKAQFSGRTFAFVEMIPAPKIEGKPSPVQTAVLDYVFIHPLSRQGRPETPEAWRSMLDEAGIKLIEMKKVATAGLYVTEL